MFRTFELEFLFHCSSRRLLVEQTHSTALNQSFALLTRRIRVYLGVVLRVQLPHKWFAAIKACDSRQNKYDQIHCKTPRNVNLTHNALGPRHCPAHNALGPFNCHAMLLGPSIATQCSRAPPLPRNALGPFNCSRFRRLYFTLTHFRENYHRLAKIFKTWRQQTAKQMVRKPFERERGEHLRKW